MQDRKRQLGSSAADLKYRIQGPCAKYSPPSERLRYLELAWNAIKLFLATSRQTRRTDDAPDEGVRALLCKHLKWMLGHKRPVLAPTYPMQYRDDSGAATIPH